MATGPGDDPNDPGELNHYQLLGVGISASMDEIQKAFRSKARQVHPDKNQDHPQAEELMKQVNKAYEVLSNSIKRSDYDEQLETGDSTMPGDFESLPHGFRLSEQFVEMFEDWKRNAKAEGIEEFLKHLGDGLQELLANPEFKASQCCVQANADTPPRTSKQKESFIEQLQLVISQSANDPTVDKELGKIQSTVEGIMHRLHANKSHEPAALQLHDGDETAMVDLSGATVNDLRFLLHLFTGSDGERLPRQQLECQVSAFVPRVRIQSPPDPLQKATHCSSCKVRFGVFKRHLVCYPCGKHFCTQCPLRQRKVPRLGATTLQGVCKACFSRLDSQEASEWVEAGLKMIKDGTLAAARAAHACFTIAFCSGADSSQSLLKIARELLHLGLGGMALNLAVLLLHPLQDPEVSVKANFLAAKALSTLTGQTGLGWGERWVLALAAKEALVDGASTLTLKCPSLSVPELETRRTQVNSTLQQLCEQKERNRNIMVANSLQQLEEAWKGRNWKQLLGIVLAKRKENVFFLSEEDTIVEALQQFLAAKEKLFERLLAEDQFPLVLLRGVVKIHRERFSEGLADIEMSAWSGYLPKLLMKAAVDIVLCLLSKGSNCNLLFQILPEVSQNLTPASIFPTCDKAISHLLPRAEDLTPPLKLQWPQLIVSGRRMMATRKYEQAVNKQVEQGKFSERDAAMAYIDFLPACDHPAEVGVSFLMAGLWSLKELQMKVGASRQQSDVNKDSSSSTQEQGSDPHLSPEIFALKEMVLQCVVQAYLIARKAFHPSMQLYVSRIALRASLTAIQVSGAHVNSHDSALVVEFLQSVMHTCRFNPFGSFPIVGVSEAVLLHILSGQLHSQFILGLQHVIPPERHPICDSELSYQLYENDLRHVCPLDDADDARACAMEALLDEKGWTVDDVADLMTSPLSPRSDEGWLIQQPQLGTSLEYAEITGFVIDLDTPSIQLLVKRPDKSNPGLFSQVDVAEVLQLPAGGMHFSLDAPSPNKQFHPFQEFNYHPAELQGTNSLHTMFEADYLLKSFSVGSEVSSVPPFNQRPVGEGLTEKLPPNFRKVIRPVTERGPTSSKIHRFWIQAEELVFKQEQTGQRLTFHLGKPKLGIRSHPLIPGLDGKLHDTKREEDPDSPEARFADDLTKHYDELGHHFPVFSRLRELVKLQFFAVVVRSVQKDLEDKAKGIGLVIPDSLLNEIHQDQKQHARTQAKSMLEELSRTVGVWPRASNEDELSAAVSRVQSQLPVYVNYFKVRSQVEALLREDDQRVLSEVTNVLMRATQQRVSRSRMEHHVQKWLPGFSPQSQSDLIEVICSALPLLTREEVKQKVMESRRRDYDSFTRTVNRVQGRPLTSQNTRTSLCKWVPAALIQHQLSDEAFSLCYGGVLLVPEVREGQVLPPGGDICTVRLDNSTGSVSFATQRPPSTAAASGGSGRGGGGGGSGRGGGGGGSGRGGGGGSGRGGGGGSGRGGGGGSGRGGGGGSGRGGGGGRDKGSGGTQGEGGGARSNGRKLKQRRKFKPKDYASIAEELGIKTNSEDDNKLDHRWSHVFTNKLGHIYPQTTREVIRAMEVLMKVYNTGRRTQETRVETLDPNAANAGYEYRVIDYERVQLWVKVNDKGEIESGGRTLWTDPRMKSRMHTLIVQTLRTSVEVCLQSGADPNTRLIDALNTVQSTKK